jgi:hypothetical protein
VQRSDCMLMASLISALCAAPLHASAHHAPPPSPHSALCAATLGAVSSAYIPPAMQVMTSDDA